MPGAFANERHRDLALCAAFEAGAVVLFAVAYSLEPAPGGIGTHTQLGLPPCLLFGVTGFPCPACGMTTAFALAVHGDPVEALVAQPFGALLAFALAAGCLALPATIAAGRRPRALLDAVFTERLAVAYLALLLLSWAYKAAVVGATTPLPPMP